MKCKLRVVRDALLAAHFMVKALGVYAEGVRTGTASNECVEHFWTRLQRVTGVLSQAVQLVEDITGRHGGSRDVEPRYA